MGMGRRVGVLRLLLAIAVVLGHAGSLGMPWLRADVAVEVFFVISGFYMQMILQTKYTCDKLGPAYIRRFYLSRYLRLLPVYLVIAVISSAFSIAVGGDPLAIWQRLADLPMADVGSWMLVTFVGATNLTMVLQDVTMFLGVKHDAAVFLADFRGSEIAIWRGLAVPPAWSLGIELSFYLLAPLLLTQRTAIIVGIAVLGLGAKFAFLTATGFGDPWTYRFFPFELGWFLIGALAYRWRSSLQVELSLLPARLANTSVYLAPLALVLFWPSGTIANHAPPLITALMVPTLFALTGKSRWDRYLGELSYPVYVTHWFVMSMLMFAFGWEPYRDPVLSAATLIVTLCGASLLTVAEARWIEPRRQRLSTPAGSGSPRQCGKRIPAT